MKHFAPAVPELTRRDFLKGGSATALMSMMGGVKLVAQTDPEPPKPVLEKVRVGVVGLGSWGRELLKSLVLLPEADVAMICDTYPNFLRRGAALAPKAAQVQDYRAIVADKDVAAVVVATPTHQHKEIVLAALQAGKHVYCEVPLAHSIEDAQAIASAAKAAPELMFQSGLQMRSDASRVELLRTFRTGVLGDRVKARAQWHQKTSWRTASANPDREKELNWRLDRGISPGLIGEIGIHFIDAATWFLNQQPVSVEGRGRIALWNDGRDVPDSIEAVLEFPGDHPMSIDITLANSFDGEYEMYYGGYSAVMLRQGDIWLFKETDSPLMGWDVYFPRRVFYKETGIVLKAGASKGVPAEDTPEAKLLETPLARALTVFLRNVADLLAARQHFIELIGDDPEALKDHLATKVKRRSAPGYLEGFRSTILALKANQAILTRTRIPLKTEWFQVG